MRPRTPSTPRGDGREREQFPRLTADIVEDIMKSDGNSGEFALDLNLRGVTRIEGLDKVWPNTRS